MFDYIYHMVKSVPSENPGTVKIAFQEHKGFTWVTPEDALKNQLMLDEDACIKWIYRGEYSNENEASSVESASKEVR